MASIRRRENLFSTTQYSISLVLLPFLGALLPATRALAQVVPAIDDTTTVVNTIGDRITITGGQLSRDETNLFQSFEQFDITSEQTANFVTTSNVQNVVGRISAGSASTINGTLEVSGSDANLYLMNPAGIFTGPNAQLNLSGGFTATSATGIEFENGEFATANSSDYRNLTGNPTGFRFDTLQPGAVINRGDLSVESGEALTLIGGTVINEGRLSAPDGTITIAAVEGENIVRISQLNQLLSLEVESSESLANSYRTITPNSIAEMVTGHESSNATTLITRPDGTVQLSSHSAAVSDAGGTVFASGALTTTGNTGGNINVLGSRVDLHNVTIDASGNQGGGLIRIGGDYKGEGALINAYETLVDETSVITADAIESGNGGRIIVWADKTTDYRGHLSAQGGLNSGNGGFAEISGKTNLVFSGSVDLRATQGHVGNVLLDPENLVITDGTPPPNTVTTSYLSSSAVEALSNTANVDLEATNNLTIEDLSDNELTFQRGRSVTFTADSDTDGNGAFIMMDTGDRVAVDSGDILIQGAGITAGEITTDLTGTTGENGGNITLLSSLGVTTGSISSNVFFSGNGSGNGGDVRIEATNGDIVVEDLIKTWSYSQGNGAGAAGNISLLASGNITTGRLFSVAAADGNNAGTGGNVTLTSSTGNITVQERIGTSSSADGNNAQSGGNVTISAPEGNILVTGDITARSISGKNNAQAGGQVTLQAGGEITTQSIDTSSSVGMNQAGNGGAITLTANSNITTQTLRTQSIVGNAQPGNGGNVNLISTDGALTTGSILTSNGSVQLDSLGSIEIGLIDASGGQSKPEETLVTIMTQGLFTATDAIAGNSISTSGTTNGAINISYNNSNEMPFVIGRASNNGTVGSITTPSSDLTDGRFLESITTGNIELVSNFTRPEVEPPVETENTIIPDLEEIHHSQPSNRITLSDLILASAQVLEEADSNRLTAQAINSPGSSEMEAQIALFERVETGLSGEFRAYLGIGDDQPQQPVATITTMQETLAEIEQTTGANPALVYVYFEPTEIALEPVSAQTSEASSQPTRSPRPDDELEIMVITADGEAIRQRQAGITRKQVENTSRNFRQQVTSQFSAAQHYLSPAQQLYNWIVDPIASTLNQHNINSLGFVLDTGIRTLPIAALHSGDRYLVEDYSLGILPSFSLTEFDQGKQNETRTNFSTAQVLAMGASRFENQPALPAVEAEVTLIADQLWEGDAFLNEAFVLDNLQTQLSNKEYDVLHLATHAIFESGNSDNSYIQLWDDQLTLNELSSLNLSESELSLIILSACNTALGDPASEYGFAGLAVSAGSQSALASLWPVSDEGTLGFMSQFYTHLREASVTAEALQQAQISLLRSEVGIADGIVYGPNDEVLATLPSLVESGQWDFSHPFYWSAFTMIGNPW